MAISDTPFDSRAPGLTLADHLALARAPRRAPERQWWNLPAKYEVSNAIADKLKKAHPGRNNHDDAMRHAEWSGQMTDKVGPIWSAAAGLAHEVAGLAGLHPLSESVMDMKNNSEGIQAALAGRPIDPRRLQDRPMSVSSAYANLNQQYEDTTAGRANYPSRARGQGSPDKGYKDAPRYDPQTAYPPYR